MASMRDIKRRKESIQSTQQITKAMKLVSTVKLQKARTRAESAKPYFQKMYDTVQSILSKSGNIEHPYLTFNGSEKKAVIVVTSNRGLAGGYNNNIVKLVADSGLPKESVEIYGIGKKGIESFERRGYYIASDDSNIINLHSWSQGSFSGMSWDKVKVMVFWVTLTMVFCFLLSKPISAYQMGVVLILLSSLLSACVTAFAGPISFVGIAVPHLMKSLFGTAKPILMIPACFLGGAVFCLFCDVLARWLFAPTEISISPITAVIGAPIVIYMMVHRRRRTGGMEA